MCQNELTGHEEITILLPMFKARRNIEHVNVTRDVTNKQTKKPH